MASVTSSTHCWDRTSSLWLDLVGGPGAASADRSRDGATLPWRRRCRFRCRRTATATSRWEANLRRRDLTNRRVDFGGGDGGGVTVSRGDGDARRGEGRPRRPRDCTFRTWFRLNSFRT